jgi:hypothetical protein
MLAMTAFAALSPQIRSQSLSMEDQLRQSLSGDEFVAHEWGTFTSLQGSDGANLPGLHYGDERLPGFVYCPLGFSYGGCLTQFRSTESGPLATTQRMETPVIYFYSKTDQALEVTVDFPKGIITEWYPAASAYSPRPHQVTALQDGTMTWDIKISTAVLPVEQVNASEIWQSQRNVGANYISVANEFGEIENENFIFYRGLAQFNPPFKVTSDVDSNLILHNEDVEPISCILLLDYNGSKGAFKLIEHLPGNKTMTFKKSEIPAAEDGQDANEYVSEVSSVLEKYLTKNGLLPLEAAAMVNTWQKSYFKSPGLRALYVLPRAWTDTFIPLRFSDTPKALERVFVGRVEILEQAREIELLKDVQEVMALKNDDRYEKEYSFLNSLNRFAEPILWRLKALTDDKALQKYIENRLIPLANASLDMR